jgi:hypothetical protein
MTILGNTGETGGLIPYEPPVLSPVGDLRDLLAGSGSQGCDGGCIDPGPDPFPAACTPQLPTC